MWSSSIARCPRDNWKRPSPPSGFVPTGSSQELEAQRLVGTVLGGKWTLDGLIGMGGMASVYAATHRNGRRAAIKLLSSELSPNAQVRQRFLREGYVANHIGHPGVVSILDDDTTDSGEVYLVMELLEGDSFLDRILETVGGQNGATGNSGQRMGSWWPG